jgi:hypothetical protein
MFDHKVNLLEELHGKPALATIRHFSGGFFTGKPQTHDHSQRLGIRPNEQIGEVAPLTLHFRHTADGYILSIKNTGEYYNQIISEKALDTFAAIDSDAETRQPLPLSTNKANLSHWIIYATLTLQFHSRSKTNTIWADSN